MIVIRRQLSRTAVLAAVAAALVSAGAIAAGPALAALSAVPGWRIVSTDSRAGIDDEIAVTALSSSNAWSGGNVSPSHSSNGVPFIEHWNGHRWSTSRLPGGLSGSIQAISASAWNDVWAFGSNFEGIGGAYALRYNGHGWRLVKRFSSLESINGAAVLSPANVWMFSGSSGAVEHYNGSRWRAVTVSPSELFYDSVKLLPDGQIWALASQGGTENVVTGTPKGSGYAWTTTALTGYSAGNSGSSPLTTIVPVSATDVWALGGGLRIVKGKDHWYPLIAHYDGVRWQKVPVSGSFTLQQDAGASDGHGGLWLTTGWDSTGIPPRILRLSGHRFTKVSIAPRDGLDVGVFGLAKIPGSASIWGVGGLVGLGATGPNHGIILKYGH
jgi:hypothetical protein